MVREFPYSTKAYNRVYVDDSTASTFPNCQSLFCYLSDNNHLVSSSSAHARRLICFIRRLRLDRVNNEIRPTPWRYCPIHADRNQLLGFIAQAVSNRHGSSRQRRSRKPSNAPSEPRAESTPASSSGTAPTRTTPGRAAKHRSRTYTFEPGA